MPKIFLIKDRLHKQQLKLLESLKHNDRDDDDRHDSHDDTQNEPLSLVARNRVRDNDDYGKCSIFGFVSFIYVFFCGLWVVYFYFG